MATSESEIIRSLRRLRYDSSNIGRHGMRTMPLQLVANLARVDYMDLNNYLVGRKPLGPIKLARIAHVVRQVEDDRVRMYRTGRKGERGWFQEIEYRDPPERRPPPQDRLVRADDWREWARCRTCQGDRWRSIAMGNSFWYACRTCVADNQLPAIGARETDAVERLALPESALREDFSFVREG
jgi:hypothetical protein